MKYEAPMIVDRQAVVGLLNIIQIPSDLNPA